SAGQASPAVQQHCRLAAKTSRQSLDCSAFPGRAWERGNDTDRLENLSYAREFSAGNCRPIYQPGKGRPDVIGKEWPTNSGGTRPCSCPCRSSFVTAASFTPFRSSTACSW